MSRSKKARHFHQAGLFLCLRLNSFDYRMLSSTTTAATMAAVLIASARHLRMGSYACLYSIITSTSKYQIPDRQGDRPDSVVFDPFRFDLTLRSR